MSLRVNRLRGNRDDYVQQLQQAGIEFELCRFSNDGITLAQPRDVNQLPGFFDGLVSVQDEAAQLAAALLAPEPGERVLDACAAPGGKTCHLLEQQPDLAGCLALDMSELRLGPGSSEPGPALIWIVNCCAPMQQRPIGGMDSLLIASCLTPLVRPAVLFAAIQT